MTHNSWVMETVNHQTEKHKNEWIERVVYISFKPAKELVDDYRILPWNLIKFMILNFANWFRIIKLVILISDPLPLAKKDWVRMKLDDQKLQTMPTLSFLLGRSLSGFWPSAFCFGHFTFFGVDFSSFHFLPESSTYASVWNINVISWPTYRSNRWNSAFLWWFR